MNVLCWRFIQLVGTMTVMPANYSVPTPQSHETQPADGEREATYSEEEKARRHLDST